MLHELLASSDFVVRATDGAALQRLLARCRVPHRVLSDGSVLVDTAAGVQPEHVARLAAEDGVLLVELRASDGTGLEELFFSLTRDNDASTTPEEVAS